MVLFRGRCHVNPSLPTHKIKANKNTVFENHAKKSHLNFHAKTAKIKEILMHIFGAKIQMFLWFENQRWF